MVYDTIRYIFQIVWATFQDMIRVGKNPGTTAKGK